MNMYEKIRNNLIAQDIHVNDDTVDFKIGHVNHDYDVEEHESFITVA